MLVTVCSYSENLYFNVRSTQLADNYWIFSVGREWDEDKGVMNGVVLLEKSISKYQEDAIKPLGDLWHIRILISDRQRYMDFLA